jgi:beta-lactamase class D
MKQNPIRPISSFFTYFLFCSGLVFSQSVAERDDWSKYFDAANAIGTIVVSDERSGSKETMAFNTRRARQRYSPASTFKIPHALFALDAGVIQDEFQSFSWDGVTRSFPGWNQDQNLRSSMRNSVVWVYESFGKILGEEGERTCLEKVQYGNQDPTGDQPFWVEGNLAISAEEQIEFLKKLYRNELPFSLAHQRLVKDIMIVEADRTWILRAKTGWSGTVGWWVGWVEHPEGPVFFALNIDTPNRLDDLPKRESITRKILMSLDALPENITQNGKGCSGGGARTLRLHPCIICCCQQMHWILTADHADSNGLHNGHAACGGS